MLCVGASCGRAPRLSHPTPCAHCITVCRSRKEATAVCRSASVLTRAHDPRRGASRPVRASVHHRDTVDPCHASIQTLQWHDRPHPCPPGQSQDAAPGIRPTPDANAPGVAPWLGVCRWWPLADLCARAVRRLPAVHYMGAAPGRRDAAGQPVLPRSPGLAMAGVVRGTLREVLGRDAPGIPAEPAPSGAYAWGPVGSSWLAATGSSCSACR